MSITKVAERAGVSRTTVSLVINNRDSISPATAQIVRRAMDELGYRPVAPEHRRGRKVKPAKTEVTQLALIANVPGAFLQSPVYADLLNGVESAAREAKIGIVLHPVEGQDQWDLKELSQSIGGLLLLGGQPQPENLGKFGTLPCIQMMRSPTAIGWCDHVTYKTESIGYLAANYLIKEEKTCTATLFQSADFPWNVRQGSFATTIESAGGTVLALDGTGAVITTDNQHDADRELLGQLIDELIAATPRPTGLFVSSDILVAPVYWLLMERGVVPGRDIWVISCNNERPLINGLHPRPAEIDIKSFAVGHQAVRRLLWRLQNISAPIADILIQPVLVEPGS